MSKKYVITVNIDVDGMDLLQDVELPLVLSKTRPGQYDIIASLKALPALKKYQFISVKPIPFTFTKSTGKIKTYTKIRKPFTSESNENFLTPLAIEQLQDVYDLEPFRRDEARGMIYDIQLDKQKNFKCAICACDYATMADTRLNLPFCSEACWDMFV